MNATDVTNVARHLFQTEGSRALSQVAREIESCTRTGDTERAKFWTRVEAVLHEMRGARQT